MGCGRACGFLMVSATGWVCIGWVFTCTFRELLGDSGKRGAATFGRIGRRFEELEKRGSAKFGRIGKSFQRERFGRIGKRWQDLVHDLKAKWMADNFGVGQRNVEVGRK